eukprot:TRINITY_DN25119_c0_g1_i1.p1 TRINITY_DN25119_c0_g1~~TRINITY_DN25119_c0_g1_i1.p1  ORF type:complete len:829 (-),score=147.95 TRINITY_DN25119_c0_g1_i1:25-2511(-)
MRPITAFAGKATDERKKVSLRAPQPPQKKEIVLRRRVSLDELIDESQSNGALRKRPQQSPAPKARHRTSSTVSNNTSRLDAEPISVRGFKPSGQPPPPPFDDMSEEEARRHCVFFHNAPQLCGEATLKQFFGRVGAVKRLRLFREDGRSKGMGMCEFSSPDSALAATQILDGECVNMGTRAAERESSAGAAVPARGARVQTSSKAGAASQKPKRARVSSSPVTIASLGLPVPPPPPGHEDTKQDATVTSAPPWLSVLTQPDELTFKDLDSGLLRPVPVSKTPPPPPPMPGRRRASQAEEEGEMSRERSPSPKGLSPKHAADGGQSFYSLPASQGRRNLITASAATDEDMEDVEMEAADREDSPHSRGASPDSMDRPPETGRVWQQRDRPPLPDPIQDHKEESSIVFFHNVPFKVEETDLKRLFERAGPVKDIRLYRMSGGRSKGQGLCEYTDAGHADKAVRVLTGFFLADPSGKGESRELRLKIHEPKDEVHPFTPSTRSEQHSPGRSGGHPRSESPDRLRFDDADEARTQQMQDSVETIPPSDAAVFFRSVPREIDRLLLWRFFSQVGKVRRLKCFAHRDGAKKLFSGTGICEYFTSREASAALSRLQGCDSDPVLGSRASKIALRIHEGPERSGRANSREETSGRASSRESLVRKVIRKDDSPKRQNDPPAERGRETKTAVNDKKCIATKIEPQDSPPGEPAPMDVDKKDKTNTAKPERTKAEPVEEELADDRRKLAAEKTLAELAAKAEPLTPPRRGGGARRDSDTESVRSSRAEAGKSPRRRQRSQLKRNQAGSSNSRMRAWSSSVSRSKSGRRRDGRRDRRRK